MFVFEESPTKEVLCQPKQIGYIHLVKNTTFYLSLYYLGLWETVIVEKKVKE